VSNGFFRKDAFRYDAERDALWISAGFQPGLQKKVVLGTF
jgi:hypothetical protein